ncbi:helix-turn-helix domain-containing protein [Devriesea agamarum]|uniref:helix-turn-helix domain-containing protein n=1 Tax=Devriesea agamarum TaxID=472569 RepID=UPI001E326EA4|nr:helix-turn-helix transcriptional regulator [Devriesea agamarum]
MTSMTKLETVSWEQARAEKLATMSDEEHARYAEATTIAEARLHIVEMVYKARINAGLTQTELARRAGTRQNVISAIENGAQVPGGVMLVRIAQAVGGVLEIRIKD